MQRWAMQYWDLVAEHRELTLAGLGDPLIGASGMPSTEPLLTAIAASGLGTDLVEPIAFLIVDAVHGSALAVPSPTRNRDDELGARRGPCSRSRSRRSSPRSPRTRLASDHGAALQRYRRR